MPTLNIQGRRVTVDDSFMSLPPEQQNAAVDEIAQSLGSRAGPKSGDMPETMSPAASQTMADLSNLSRMRSTGNVDTDREVRAAMEASKIRSMQGGMPSAFKAATDSVANGAMFGWADEAASALGTPFRMMRDRVGPGEAYKRELALQQELQRQNREAHPVASMAGELAGGMMTGGTLVKGGATMIGRNVPMLGRTGAAAMEGAAYGGVYGAGDANPGERLSGAAKGAVIGGIMGGASEKIGGAIASRISKAKTGPAPTMDELASEASTLYQSAENAGVQFKPEATNKLSYNVDVLTKKFALDPELQPETTVVLKRIAEARGKPLSLMEMENLRKIALGVSREAGKASDRKAAGMVVDQIDNIMSDGRNIAAGNTEAIGHLQQARDVWKRMRKMETLNEINEKALNHASGYENGLVTQLRALANNPKRMRAFSPEEQKLITNAVRRGSVRGVLKALGMLSPNSTFGGITTGGTMMGQGFGAGAMLGGAGFAAKKGAEAMTRAQFRALGDAVARGGVQGPPVRNLAPRFIPGLAVSATSLGAPLLPSLPPLQRQGR